jgi:hypothetical protein
MTSMTVQSPRTVTSPRGAVWGAWVFQTLSSSFQTLSRMMRERADRRAAQVRIGDASSVRRYAMSVMQYDPRFAADLFAAADRHEQMSE